MSSQANVDRRNDSSGRRAFPDKANPNRPPRGREAAVPRGPRDGGPYPEKCEPNHPRAPLTEDQRELAVQYLPLAQGIAQQLKTPAAEGDELKSTAYLALVEAARTFDPARNVNFATYAQHRIRGALLDSQRYWLYGEWHPGVADTARISTARLPAATFTGGSLARSRRNRWGRISRRSTLSNPVSDDSPGSMPWPAG